MVKPRFSLERVVTDLPHYVPVPQEDMSEMLKTIFNATT